MNERVETEDGASRKRRKEEAKLLKRKRIEESGGKRPRENKKVIKNGTHRFGRVMEAIPCRNRPRFSTLSIALPGSVVSNCQTKELRTNLIGQIARAATIYHVDEIVVFDDKLSREVKDTFRQRRLSEKETEKDEKQNSEKEYRRFDPHEFMARLLQFCECPQYLRRSFFPMHPDLQFAGLLAPVDAPHHVRSHDRSKYREGVVLDKTGPSGGSLVNCGIPGRLVEINAHLQKGIRCTVKLEPSAYNNPGPVTGEVVSPSAPREDNGTYWGYTTRLANSINDVLDECPFEGGYDLKIGTSERGDHSLEKRNFELPAYKHAIIVFGGVAGIEECIDADESMKLQGSQSKKLFDYWINVCPFQGSRTIRTEEAVLITLSRLDHLLVTAGESNGKNKKHQVACNVADLPNVEFSDQSISDESGEESLED